MIRSRLINYWIALRVVFYKFLSDRKIVIIGKPLFKQPVLFQGKGTIKFGSNVELGFSPSPNYYNAYIHLEARHATSYIELGDNVLVNNNLKVIAEKSSIFIGNNCLIGINVEIIDSDFHSISPELRRSGSHSCKPVRIQENVFIGNNVIIMKGVFVGQNSIIANGSVVTKSIPENVIAAGNPAKVIRNI
jgi:acetyltransferase-like isoleucine patch superfamily enzyme